MAKGKDVPVDLLVKAQASTFVAGGLLATWASLDSQGLIEAGGPVDPQVRVSIASAWRQKARQSQTASWVSRSTWAVSRSSTRSSSIRPKG